MAFIPLHNWKEKPFTVHLHHMIRPRTCVQTAVNSALVAQVKQVAKTFSSGTKVRLWLDEYSESFLLPTLILGSSPVTLKESKLRKQTPFSAACHRGHHGGKQSRRGNGHPGYSFQSVHWENKQNASHLSGYLAFDRFFLTFALHTSSHALNSALESTD